MADREKTIKRLECCGEWNMCRNHCPYGGPENDIKNCTSQLARDALELLKAQEPRVMTLEEVKNAEIVWIEQVGQCVPAIKIHTWEDGKMMFAYSYEDNIHTINIMPKYYDRISRCWNSRPTDEQREATPWK